MIFDGVCVRVLPARSSRQAAIASVWVAVDHAQTRSSYRITKSVQDVLAFWDRAHTALCCRPRNALLAALSMERGGLSALTSTTNLDCASCGLHHLSLLTEPCESAGGEICSLSFPTLVRPPPSRNDITVTSTRLRTTTFEAFFRDVVVLMVELERQEVLRRKCDVLQTIYSEAIEFLARGHDQFVVESRSAELTRSPVNKKNHARQLHENEAAGSDNKEVA